MTAYPAFSVDVAFTTDPYAVPSWTSVSGYAKKLQIVIGRTNELDPYPPGRLAVDLENIDRRFDPLHAAGPYFGNLKPNKKIRVRAVSNAVTYDMFYGFVDAWPQVYSPPSDAIAAVTATDGLKRLAKSKPSYDVYADEVRVDTPRAWWRMGDTSGPVFTDYSGNGYDLTPTGSVPVASMAKDALIKSENGSAKMPILGTMPAPSGSSPPTGTTWSAEFWIKTEGQPFRQDAVTTTAAGSGIVYNLPAPSLISGAPGPTFVGFGIQLLRDDSTPTWGQMGGLLVTWTGTTSTGNVGMAGTLADDRIHHVVVVHNGNDAKIWVDGADRTDPDTFTAAVGTITNLAGPVVVNRASLTSTGEPSTWASGPIMDEIAIYTQALSSTRIQAHYQAGIAPWNGDRTGARVSRILDRAGWPAADRNIDTGLQLLGAAEWPVNTTALTLIDEVEQSELGEIYVDHGDGGKMRFRQRTSRYEVTRSNTSQVTFSDDGTNLTAKRYSGIIGSFDASSTINSVTVKWRDGTVIATDTASIASYGEVGLSLETILPDYATASYYAAGLLNRYKTPNPKFESILLNPGADDGLIDEVLARRIGDRITVRRLPQSVGSAISFDCIVEGIEIDADEGIGVFLATYYLSRADPAAYWILGTSAIGSTAILGF